MESEQKSKEIINQQMITDLKHLRDDYSEDIPDEILHSPMESPPPKYKVRKAWFTVLVAMLDNLFRDNLIINVELNQKIQRYKKSVVNFEFTNRLTTRNDIDEANSLINEIIAELEK